jgi:superfamily II DNA or RNA helicase
MKIDLKKEEISLDAFSAWKAQSKKGTVEMSTGSGKTFVALHAVNSMKDNNRIIFLFEVTDRKKEIIKQIQLYNQVYKTNLFTRYRIEYRTYQSAYKLESEKYDLVVADEIHDSLTPSYFEFYNNNTFDAIIGLSATIDKEKLYSNGYTKGDYLDSVAPICFTYTVKDAQLDNVQRKINVYVISHQLDTITKNITAGSLKKPFQTTEYKNYEFWNKMFNQSFYFEEGSEFMMKKSSKKRAEILYNLPSKKKEVLKLIEYLKGKSIIFANSISALLEITDNVVSSRNKDNVNEKIKNDFQSNVINVIGSFKKLAQGVNLDELANVILHSYYGKTKDFIQRIGRLRKDGDKIGNVFIFVTKGTQEEKWFNLMFQDDTFNIIYCVNVEDCLLKMKK